MGRINQKQNVLLQLSRRRDDSNEGLLQIIRDQQKKHQATVTQLESIIELLTRLDPYISANRREGTSQAAISLERLLRILSSSPGTAANNGRRLDLNFLKMRDNNLHTIVSSAA